MAEIEFFHNVVCSYCFVQSKRLRNLMEDYPDIGVKHRSFPLKYQKNKEAFPFRMYDDKSGDILKHWESANRIDEEHRFNIEGMREKVFEFPTSRLAEIAIKAGVMAGGAEVHWDLFVRNLNIGDDPTVRDLIKETDIEYDKWENLYEDPETEQKLFKDYELVEEYDLNLIPSIVLEEEKVIKGALRPKIIANELDELTTK